MVQVAGREMDWELGMVTLELINYTPPEASFLRQIIKSMTT